MVLSTNEPGPLLQAVDLCKAYPGVQALWHVDFEVRPGEIHALLGENGAGKSTLVRILAGAEHADQGELRLQGDPVRFATPREAILHGIGLVSQEPMPFPHLTVAENLMMGREPSTVGCVRWKRLREEAARALADLGLDISPSTRLGELRLAEIQMVEIARALLQGARLLVFDEPTAALATREIERLFVRIRELRAAGVGIVYITHRMDEVRLLADRITILRDGKRISTHLATEIDDTSLIREMVGRSMTTVFPKRERSTGSVLLELRGLSKQGCYRDISFTVQRGEIVGLAGLLGAGRTELINAVAGLSPADSGEIRWCGRVRVFKHPRAALASGIAWVPEDRQRLGLVPCRSVLDNLTLSALPRWSPYGWIHRVQERAAASALMNVLGLRGARMEQPAVQLSGGNQQKLLLGRALLCQPELLILDEPTRGIDLGARAEIYAWISRLASEGKAILLVSSELPELLGLSDRVLVMCQGELRADLSAEGLSPERVMESAMPVPRAESERRKAE